MIEVQRERVQVTSFDGHQIGAFLHRAPSTPAPGLVMIPEIFGINLPLRKMAARYAAEGWDFAWRMHPRMLQLGVSQRCAAPAGRRRGRMTRGGAVR